MVFLCATEQHAFWYVTLLLLGGLLFGTDYGVFQFTSHFHVTVPQLDKSELQNWSKRKLHNGAQSLIQNQVVVQSHDVVK